MSPLAPALIVVPMLTALSAGCQQSVSRVAAEGTPASAADGDVREYRDVVVEAACGQCQLGLHGDGCDLAVRIDGASYFVNGTGIDDHGDAHAADGLCNSVRDARVSGHVADGRFIATRFELISP